MGPRLSSWRLSPVDQMLQDKDDGGGRDELSPAQIRDK